MADRRTTSTAASREPQTSCRDCERSLEACAFCERQECPEAVCFQCLRVGLKESIAEPHGHGG
jgi:hypothetical protein